MKPLLAVAVLGLALLMGLFYDDPRDAGPAAIPDRFLVKADDECRQALAASMPGQAAAFCGCVLDWSRDNLTFRDLRALKVELDATDTTGGGAPESYVQAAGNHPLLGPVIARCRAAHEP